MTFGNKIEKKKPPIFISSHKMSRRNPSRMSHEQEINVQDYPYHRFIPIDHISQKQQQILNRVPIEYAKREPLIEPPPPQIYEERPMPPQEYYYQEQEYRHDRYQLETELKKLQGQLERLYEDVQESASKLDGQELDMKRNEDILEEQRKKIEQQKGVIDHNIAQINTTIQTYSHNVAASNYQAQQIHANNAEIYRQQQVLESLNAQVSSTQQQVDDVNAQLAQVQQELAYHQSMLSAFNTMIHNPQYFVQLMSSAMSASIMYKDESPDGV